MSNIIKNDKIIAWIKIVIGISMPIAVLIGYLPIPEYLVEFTCISNTLGGLLLVADGILNLRGKSVPGVFYRNISVGIFFVFLDSFFPFYFLPQNANTKCLYY